MSDYHINIEAIKALIPHRHPFLLIDKITEFTAGETITAVKNITMNEHYFLGHFPGAPTVPGVLMIESMAQAAAVLVAKTLDSNYLEKDTFLTGIDNAKFRRIVEPGDQLLIKITLLKHKAMIWKFSGKIFVGGELAVEAEFNAAVKDKLIKD